MLERLLEFWLDSASERSYQPAFVQILVTEGYRVVHNTRHGPIEFGKDVVALSPKGELCLFQLKGNPRSRLTHAQLREIQPQLLELATYAPATPDLPREPRRNFLVTNGEIDEEAELAINALNAGLIEKGYSKIEIIRRGELLARAQAVGNALWPVSIASAGIVIQLLAQEGDDRLPRALFHELLSDTLNLRSETLKKAEIDRSVPVAALLVSLGITKFAQRGNWLSCVESWLMFIAHVIAVHERTSHSFSATTKSSIEIARFAIRQNLANLTREVSNHNTQIEGDAWADTEFYAPRQALVCALLSVLWFWNKHEDLDNDEVGLIESFLPFFPPERSLWGEAAIPGHIAHYFYYSAKTTGIRSEFILAKILDDVLRCQMNTKTENLASPYYDIEEVVRHRYPKILRTTTGIDRDDFGQSSFMALPLFELLVRANMKQTCKQLWPRFSKLVHKFFDVEESWEYCLPRASKGIERARLFEPAAEWPMVRAAAAESAGNEIPAALRNDPVLLLLYCVLFPNRATPSAIRCVGRQLSPIWFYYTDPKQ